MLYCLATAKFSLLPRTFRGCCYENCADPFPTRTVSRPRSVQDFRVIFAKNTIKEAQRNKWNAQQAGMLHAKDLINMLLVQASSSFELLEQELGWNAYAWWRTRENQRQPLISSQPHSTCTSKQALSVAGDSPEVKACTKYYAAKERHAFSLGQWFSTWSTESSIKPFDKTFL